MSRYFINILGKFIFSLVDPLRSKVAPFGGRQSLHSLKLVLNVCLDLGKKCFDLRNLGIHFGESGLRRVADPHLLSDQPL